MTTQDPSSSTLGPRYAPNDPSLPEPWKGLIDGSTGVLYYWNPETNVTQYERPASLPPRFQTETPPAGDTARLKSLPEARALQRESIQTTQNHQMVQNQLPQGQLAAAATQPQIQAWDSQQRAPTRQLQGPQLGSSIPLSHLATEQLRAQMVQQASVQMQSQAGQLPLQQGQPVHQHSMQQTQQASYQPVHSLPYAQPAPVYQGSQIGAPLGYQFMPQNNPHMVHQQTISLQKPQNSSQHLTQGQQLQPKQENRIVHGQRDNMEFHQGGSDLSPAHQHSLQGQQFSHARDIKAGISQRNDVEVQQVKKTNPSPSHIQQAGKPSLLNSSTTQSSHAQELNFQPNQSLHVESVTMQQNNHSVRMHKGGAELPNLEYGSAFQTQTGPGMIQGHPQNIVQAHRGGTELSHQDHEPISHNRMTPGVMHGQPHNIMHGGPKMPYEEKHLGRLENDYLHNTSRDANRIPLQLPKLAPLPTARNQLEMRSGDMPTQNVTPTLPGRLDDHAGLPFHGVYRQSSSGPPYPNSAFAKPLLPTMGPSDPMHLSAAEVYCQKHEVTASGENVPAPFMTFEAAGFPPELLQELHLAGFTAPTPIQAQTWPIALQNRDIVAIAKTGSGKTLGYLIPAFMHLRTWHNNPQNGPTVLVLAPTRELATQIQDEAIKFGRSSRLSCTCLYGGAPKGPQLRELERGADIVIATPGRLNDILEMKRIDFRQVSLLVLDEADRMLDMGFEPQIRKIVNMIPPRRQTLMYTATWPKEVRKIAGDLLVNPVQVNIGSVDELAANKSITQYVEMVPEMEKQRRLEQILRSQEQGSKVIIFCSTKKLCDHLARSLGRFFGAAAIHGDKSQGERDWVLNQFRSGKSQVLVATDVAARGLDIRDIRVVVNYDFPTGIEDYVHRIGRTGRAGASGVSYTFFSEQDWKYAPDLVKVLEGANQAVPPEIRDIALRGGPSFGRDRGINSLYGSADGGGRGDPGDRGGMRDGGFGGRGGNFGGRGGMRDDNFGGHGGIRDANFGARGGTRDGGFSGRGGMRDGGFGGRGGGMRDGGFSGRGGGMRDGGFSGRGGGRDGNFFNPSGGRVGWDRGGGRGTNDRFGNFDIRGRGRGRGRGRFDNRRDNSDRSRGRSFTPSPDRVRTWDYSRSRSSSRSRSRSRSRGRRRSYSRSRSRSRSWSRSRSPPSSRSRSRSRSYERYARRPPRQSKFDQMEVPVQHVEIPVESRMSLSSPAARGNGVSEAALSEQQAADIGHHSNGATAGPNDPR